MNEIKRYVNAVERHLRLDRATRLRVMNDLASDLQSRLDSGETLADIQAELGDARTLADTFNREFDDHRDPASPWRWAFLTLAAAVAVGSVCAGVHTARQVTSLGIIGGADGPTTIYVATRFTAPSLLRTFAWLAGLLGGYVLLGPARRSGKWLPLAIGLCAAGTVLALVWWVLYTVSVLSGGLPFVLYTLAAGAVYSGVWLCALLLWRALRARRRQ